MTAAAKESDNFGAWVKDMFIAWIVLAIVATHTPAAAHEQCAERASELLGTWRGTSVCTDRVAAPACHDEIVVYEFTQSASPDTVHWKADKIVDGQQQPMGELDLGYDAAAGCWQGELSSPRVHGVWRLKVTDAHISGGAWLLPDSVQVRKVEVDRQ